MANELQGERIAFLVAPEGVEQVELSEPWKAVKNAGGTPELLSLSPARSKPSTTSTEGISFPCTGWSPRPAPPTTKDWCCLGRGQPRLPVD